MKDMRFLPATVARGDAEERLRRRWPWSERRLELLCLPAWAFRVRVEGAEGVVLACDALLGRVARMRLQEEDLAVEPPGPVLASRIPPERALALVTEAARDLVLGACLREKRRCRLLGVESLGAVGRPFWVRYHVGPLGYGLRACDAVTGARADGVQRRALALGLVGGFAKLRSS